MFKKIVYKNVTMKMIKMFYFSYNNIKTTWFNILNALHKVLITKQRLFPLEILEIEHEFKCFKQNRLSLILQKNHSFLAVPPT